VYYVRICPGFIRDYGELKRVLKDTECNSISLPPSSLVLGPLPPFIHTFQQQFTNFLAFFQHSYEPKAHEQSSQGLLSIELFDIKP